MVAGRHDYKVPKPHVSFRRSKGAGLPSRAYPMHERRAANNSLRGQRLCSIGPVGPDCPDVLVDTSGRFRPSKPTMLSLGAMVVDDDACNKLLHSRSLPLVLFMRADSHGERGCLTSHPQIYMVAGLVLVHTPEADQSESPHRSPKDISTSIIMPPSLVRAGFRRK
jgi:hypothetical protein